MSEKVRVVVHEDDVGMNHGANAAFAELFELGICTAGSVMVPCPWFLEVAEMQAKNPRLDIGVHLVLTSEFRTYRWRPLTGASQASGLVDARRLFLADGEGGARARASGCRRGRASRAGRGGEDGRHRHHPYRRAHVHRALPDFIDIYTRLGREERVPVLLVRQDAAYGSMEKGAAVDAAIEAADAEGLPVFDRVLETPWQRGVSVEADYDALLDRLGPGLNYMALHFNAAGRDRLRSRPSRRASAPRNMRSSRASGSASASPATS